MKERKRRKFRKVEHEKLSALRGLCKPIIRDINFPSGLKLPEEAEAREKVEMVFGLIRNRYSAFLFQSPAVSFCELAKVCSRTTGWI